MQTTNTAINFALPNLNWSYKLNSKQRSDDHNQVQSPSLPYHCLSGVWRESTTIELRSWTSKKKGKRLNYHPLIHGAPKNAEAPQPPRAQSPPAQSQAWQRRRGPGGTSSARRNISRPSSPLHSSQKIKISRLPTKQTKYSTHRRVDGTAW